MQAAGESIGEGPTAPHPFAKADIDTSPAAVAEAEKIEDSVKDEETPGESTED
jgi:molecular chaperone DnaK/molecular chaperone HscA